MLLTDILRENAKNFPKKFAFTMKFGFRTRTFNYLQVYKLAQKTTLFFQANGINKNDKILIYAPNSPYWGIIFWAALLKGAVLVPVNVQSTQEMIKKILKQTEAKIIFKSKFFKTNFDNEHKVFEIEYLEEFLKDINLDNYKDEEIDENHLVEILYTSGTTGDPKGVLLTHKNICSNIEAISKKIKLDCAKERLLSILPLTHIFEQTVGFFLPQSYASHIIYTHSYAAILELMQKYKITKFIAVPEFLKILISKVKFEYSKKGLIKLFNFLKKVSLKLSNKYIAKILFYPVHKKFGNKLNTVASGGAFLDPELEKEWIALGFDVLQGYGLTETSPIISTNTYNERKLGSVGKAIDNIELRLDKDGQILVKGPGVFSGYFKNEEKTKESFTKDGFFKTGDVGEVDKEGFLFLKGRKKYVIVGPGGQNVFPEDIEFILNKMEGVQDSCVLGVTQESGMVRIHAVLLLEDKDKHESSINASEIIDKANKELASYQKINDFTIWQQEDFPRSATRKIKKEEVLKEIKGEKDQKPDEQLEEKLDPLINILSQISGISVNEIKPHKKIITDLQLDSLMIVELILRIEDKYGILLDESLIVDDTTVSDLKEIIQKKEPLKEKETLNRWPRSFWAKVIRAIGQFKLLLFSKIFFRLNVKGLNNIKNLKTPVLFMPNHLSYADPVVILMVLPYKIRKKLCFAAARDVLYEEYKHVAWLAELFFNSFPLPRTNGGNIRQGLDHMGQLIDNGNSIVVFPEGKMSKTRELLPFKKGAGLMAVEMQCPVVPIKIIGSQNIVPYGKLFPRKIDKVSIIIGKPIKFSLQDSYEKATLKIEKSLRAL
ncbi:AMP-binding protein [Candidatus Dependentiae bacterium]|nr:AMP-binding protein [Candidatus Dependentiae bacterium]